MKLPCQELSIDMVIDESISNNNPITFILRFSFILKTGMGLPKTRDYFYCVIFS